MEQDPAKVTKTLKHGAAVSPINWIVVHIQRARRLGEERFRLIADSRSLVVGKNRAQMDVTVILKSKSPSRYS